MTKISSADVVKVGKGTCDFCQVPFIEGPLGEITYDAAVVARSVKVIVGDARPRNFGNGFIINDYNFENQYKTQTTKVHPLICWDCVKEFSKIKHE